MLIISKSLKMSEIFKTSCVFTVDIKSVEQVLQLATVNPISRVYTQHIPNSDLFFKIPEKLTTQNVRVSINYNSKNQKVNIYLNNSYQVRTHTMTMTNINLKQRNEISIFTFRYDTENQEVVPFQITFKKKSIL